MFSNDKNVETIAQLFKVLKRYFGLQAEYTKLSIVEIIVRLLTAVALIAVFVTLFLIALIYFSFAAAIAIGEALGCALGLSHSRFRLHNIISHYANATQGNNRKALGKVSFKSAFILKPQP